ncbi:hypothetical protein COT97_04725 [Candidatus Falkowbacteria bacterium CG10_big_fil_rev_8_21_14_0_10_39_11]|uniref:Uncharacterized protein n=1 Tax=Candidatus Falkowbacteria bacterium CG10_big_fil_rev_8_21_14_0_10_39_11 TaxID=1974565 RepID=A0A2H0V455_9BACT|nr:MAG: hypothetical protein COT97_04725 [Candidatus Falkowbacteria bacterium CG10_big_fil_rev_8_21_14_0_10_39_11]
MTKDSLLKTLNLYEHVLKSAEVKIQEASFRKHYKTDKQSTLEHCHSMINQIRTFVANDNMDKAWRWLGFLQGCFWTLGLFSLNELREHNS